MIKAENLVKRYGSNFALDGVSFEIGDKEVVGLLGPNGAGKSTAMNILTGYLSATEGVAYICGVNVLDDPKEAKRKIGYLPEQPPVYPEMTVIEYLNFVYDLKGCRLDRHEHIDEICDVVKISDVKERLIGHLSKGYRQRVGIAQALVGDPPVLIFDEPTVGLDPKQIIEIRNLIRTLGAKHTVILSTHILSEVQAVCGRVIIINKGKIIADKPTAELSRAIDDSFRYKIKICAPEKECISALRDNKCLSKAESTGERDGDACVYIVENKPGIDPRKSIYFMCSEHRWPLLELSPVGMELEDIFIRLIDRGIADTDKKQKQRKGRD